MGLDTSYNNISEVLGWLEYYGSLELGWLEYHGSLELRFSPVNFVGNSLSNKPSCSFLETASVV